MNLKRLRDLHSKCSMITVTSQTIMEHLIHIFSHLSFFLSLSVCLNQFPPIMTKENIFCTRFSDHVKMCCDSSTWAILLLFSKNGSVFRAALLNSMKYRDHFLISSHHIFYFFVAPWLNHTRLRFQDYLKYRNCISVLSISKKHILTTKKILRNNYLFSSWWTKQLTLILILLHSPVVSVDFLLAYLPSK